MDVSAVCGRLGGRADAPGVRGVGPGHGAFAAGNGAAHAGDRPVVRTQPAGPSGDHASGRGAGIYRGATGPRLRHLRPGERAGVGLSGAVVVDDGLLVTAAAGPPGQPDVPRRVGLRRRMQRASAAGIRADRRAGADHDVDRRADLASPRADRAGRRILAGGLPDLPDGLLRTAGSEYRAGQGCRGRQVVARHDLRVELQPAVRTVGAVGAVGAAGIAVDDGAPPAVVPASRAGTRLRSGGPGGAKSAGRGGFHRRQRRAAGAVLGSARRRLYARPGVAGAAVLFAGPGGGHSYFAARR
ncbi:Uncharacterised protein [Mycobacterium tuberculosis]|nr:Uncharacterised protein [Mycobacterium tuberculosis]